MELTQIQKDYNFFPSQTTSLEFLKKVQVDKYNEQGFISPIKAFDKKEIKKHRTYFDNLLFQLKADPLKAELGLHTLVKDTGPIHNALNCFHTRVRGIWEIMYSEKILPAVRDLIGKNVVAWATHYFCKLPHDNKCVSYHQDASYWSLSNSKSVTVWLAIDDTDEDNAAMQFIPKSHLVGHIPWKETNEDSVLEQQIRDISVFDSPHSNNLKAGEFSIHSSLLAHGSGKNESNRRRCGLTIRYAPPDVIPLDPRYTKRSYFVCGDFDSEYWIDNIPPESYDL